MNARMSSTYPIGPKIISGIKSTGRIIYKKARPSTMIARKSLFKKSTF